MAADNGGLMLTQERALLSYSGRWLLFGLECR